MGGEVEKDTEIGKTIEIIVGKDMTVAIMVVEISNVVFITIVTLNMVTGIGMVVYTTKTIRPTQT